MISSQLCLASTSSLLRYTFVFVVRSEIQSSQAGSGWRTNRIDPWPGSFQDHQIANATLATAHQDECDYLQCGIADHHFIFPHPVGGDHQEDSSTVKASEGMTVSSPRNSLVKLAFESFSHTSKSQQHLTPSRMPIFHVWGANSIRHPRVNLYFSAPRRRANSNRHSRVPYHTLSSTLGSAAPSTFWRFRSDPRRLAARRSLSQLEKEIHTGGKDGV
jgi:hypothetical protein